MMSTTVSQNTEHINTRSILLFSHRKKRRNSNHNNNSSSPDKSTLKLRLPPLIHSLVHKLQNMSHNNNNNKKITSENQVQQQQPQQPQQPHTRTKRSNSFKKLAQRLPSMKNLIVSSHHHLCDEQIQLPIPLPIDCLSVIIDFLDYLSILRLPFVSTQFYKLFCQPSMDRIWNRIIVEQYSIVSDDNSIIERRSDEIKVEGQPIHGLRSIEAYRFLRSNCCYQCGSSTKCRIRYRVCSRFKLDWYKGPKSVRICLKCHEHGTIEKKELKPEMYGISSQEGGCLPMCSTEDGRENLIPYRICYEACLYKHGMSVLQYRMKIRALELREYIRGMAWVEEGDEIGKPDSKFNQSVKMAVSRLCNQDDQLSSSSSA